MFYFNTAVRETRYKILRFSVCTEQYISYHIMFQTQFPIHNNLPFFLLKVHNEYYLWIIIQHLSIFIQLIQNQSLLIPKCLLPFHTKCPLWVTQTVCWYILIDFLYTGLEHECNSYWHLHFSAKKGGGWSIGFVIFTTKCSIWFWGPITDHLLIILVNGNIDRCCDIATHSTHFTWFAVSFFHYYFICLLWKKGNSKFG